MQALKTSKPISFSKIGSWWGHYREESVRKPVEIDAIAIDEEGKKILFAECKWKEKADASEILRELRQKASKVEWNNERRSEYYAIFAKSFKEKKAGENVFLYDLKDLQKIFKTKELTK